VDIPELLIGVIHLRRRFNAGACGRGGALPGRALIPFPGGLQNAVSIWKEHPLVEILQEGELLPAADQPGAVEVAGLGLLGLDVVVLPGVLVEKLDDILCGLEAVLGLLLQ